MNTWALNFNAWENSYADLFSLSGAERIWTVFNSRWCLRVCLNVFGKLLDTENANDDRLNKWLVKQYQ